MKKIILFGPLVAVLFASVLTSHAKEEEAIPFEEKHKDKDCIFLLYEVAVKLNEDWSYTSSIHKKVKILKEEAKDMGEIPIQYEKGRDEIGRLEAYTITPDGERLRHSKIQDFNIFKGYPMYSDARVKVVTLPEVNVGSVLEYEAVVESKGKPIKNAFWYMFDLNAATIPIKEMRYTVTLPKNHGMQYKEFNLEYKPIITEEEATITYSWQVQDIDDYTLTEGYFPPPDLDDIANLVEFSSIKSWSGISDWYHSLIQDNLKANSKIENAAKEVFNGRVGTKDKVKGALEYIQDNFRYVSMSFGDHALEPHPTDEVFRNKYGDCKDLSLLCMAMLQLGGIKSDIALFNTEYSLTAPETDLPFPSLFDHVLVLVEDPEEGNFYIDPLLEGYDIGEYPMNYQCAYTFVITEEGGRFDRFPVFDEKRSYVHDKHIVTIRPDGSVLMETESFWDLDLSIETRAMFNAMNGEQSERFIEVLDAALVSGGEMLERRIEGLDQKYGPLKSYTKIIRPDFYPITDDMIIIDLSTCDRTTAFTEKERENPIFYATNSLEEDVTVYRIPEGFRVSYLPKDLNLDIGFSNIKRECESKENEIIVTQVERYRRLELPREDYNKVKDFYDRLPQRTNQRIVLKKIKPWWEEVKDIFKRFKN